MKKTKILIILSFIALIVFVCLIRISKTSSKPKNELPIAKDDDIIQQTTRKDVEVPTEPQNGIPLVIITVYEDDEVIDNANREDIDYEYGNIEEINNSIDHSVRGKGNVQIILPENYVGEYGSIDIPEGPQELEYIRGRGNSTWRKEKKPYKIRYKESHNILGMGENKEWGLLANYKDYTLCNNAITMWVASKMGMEYIPQMVPVDVVMKGTQSQDVYLGSYYLTELVDLGNGRIEVPELAKEETENITGGYLLSIYFEDQDKNEPESTVFRAKYSGLKLINENPEFKSEDLAGGSKAQREYIRNYIDEIDDIIMNNDIIEGETHDRLAELMDLESLADFYLLQEFFINIDSFKTSSNYLYKKPNGKLYWGPLWDFDKIFYNVEIDKPETYSGFDFHTANPWVDNLRYKDEEFVKLLQERWEKLNPILEEVTKEGGVLDKYKERGRTSWEVNKEIWFSNEDLNCDEEFEKLRKLIELRREWFNNNITNIGKESFNLDEVDSN